MKDSRPAVTFAATTSSSPGSKIGMRPCFRSASCWASVSISDVVAEFRETGARHQPDIAAADHRYPHKISPLVTKPKCGTRLPSESAVLTAQKYRLRAAAWTLSSRRFQKITNGASSLHGVFFGVSSDGYILAKPKLKHGIVHAPVALALYSDAHDLR